MATSAVGFPVPDDTTSARLDAAHALLGVAPSQDLTPKHALKVAKQPILEFPEEEKKESEPFRQNSNESCVFTPTSPSPILSVVDADNSGMLPKQQTVPAPVPFTVADAPKVGSSSDGGTRASCPLDALAMLASNAVSMDCDDPSELRKAANESHRVLEEPSVEVEAATTIRRRERSASNPEGMEKWDSLLRGASCSRRHFVQPSIAEEVVPDSTATGDAGSTAVLGGSVKKLPFKKRVNFSPATSSPVPEPLDRTGVDSPHGKNAKTASELDLEEMLRQARSRLLEDLVTGTTGNGSGGLVLPHSLTKYRDVYNKNGRIGIYTPAERAAIIARFNSKRTRRVWNKKIRYSCRKNLADRRLRVKGRFVKRSKPDHPSSKLNDQQPTLPAAAALFVSPSPSVSGSGGADATLASCSSSSPMMKKEEIVDDEMPDVNDVEAGFSPTKDQPYRRTRRHTIT